MNSEWFSIREKLICSFFAVRQPEIERIPVINVKFEQISGTGYIEEAYAPFQN